ncbi:hypothetical protein ACLIA0_12360 [Bacillaceae bacterium W0354]
MGNKRLIEHSLIDSVHLNRDTWPEVLIENLKQDDQLRYLNRKKAVDLYFDGDMSVKDICELTNIKKQQLFRFVKNCLEFDENGELLGYRALIPYFRINKYTRNKDINGFLENGDHLKLNGAFKDLLDKHPILKETIDNYYLDRMKRDIREPIIRVKFLHRKFISLCKSIGLDPVKGDYPFNTDDLGRRALYRYINELKHSYSSESILRFGDDAATLHNNTGTGEQNNYFIRPFQRVEFDGHKIDGIFVIEFETPEGDVIVDELSRFWLLAVIDVSTRVTLGYHLCFKKEYSAVDVLECIRNAIIPWKPMEFTIPNLKYTKNGGFASGKIPEYAVWDEMSFDNAKANLASKVTEKLKTTIGCTVNTGPVGTPTRRPIIEKLFHLLEENGFRRLPNTTGSHPNDPIRKNPGKEAKKYKITVEELTQLVEVLIADRNGTPQHGTNGLTPLEVMQQRVITRGMEPRILEEEKRDDINLLTYVGEVTVRGNIKKGRRPYVYYMGVEYRNDLLSNSYHLVGQKLKIVINSDDLRFFKAFLPNGAELGLLKAKGKWSLRKHSLEMRQTINKLHRKGLIHFTNEDDPIDILFEYLRMKSKNHKPSRNQLVSFESEMKTSDIKNSIQEKMIVSSSKEHSEEEDYNKNHRRRTTYVRHERRRTFNE